MDSSLTDDTEIHPRVPCGGVSEVHATPVDALVPQLNVIDEQLSGTGCGAEIRAVRKGSWRGPEFRVRHVPHSHIETGERKRRRGVHGVCH